MKNLKKFVFCVLAVLILATCRTVEVEKSVKSSTGKGKQSKYVEVVPLPVPIDTEPIIIERTLFVPQTSAPTPAQGRTAVEQSNRVGIIQPQDYSHAAMLYHYHRDHVYEVFCRPLRVTDIT
jgi:uncharacterized lipoprotein